MIRKPNKNPAREVESTVRVAVAVWLRARLIVTPTNDGVSVASFALAILTVAKRYLTSILANVGHELQC